jgi:hypothetical protein
MNMIEKILAVLAALIGLIIAILTLRAVTIQQEVKLVSATPTLEYILLTPTIRPTSDPLDMPVPEPIIQSIGIDEMSLQPDVQVENQLGMLIHAKLTAHNLRGDKFQVGASFFQQGTGEPIKSLNDSYQSEQGQLATWRGTETIPSDEVTFPDVTLFVPYDAFNLPAGTHELQYQIWVYFLTPQIHGPTKSASNKFTLLHKGDNAITVVPDSAIIFTQKSDTPAVELEPVDFTIKPNTPAP